MIKVCPCKGCVPPKRNADCHSVCPEYKEWNDEHQKHLEEVRKKSRDDQDFRHPYSQQCRIIRRSKRRGNN